jgi:phage terminase large subunit-like protein
VRALEAVETGQHIDHLFAFIACADSEDLDVLFDLDADSEEFVRVVRKANPNYPITPTRAYIRKQFLDAKNDALEQAKFLRFHVNVQVSSSIIPLSAGDWTQASRPIEDMPAESRGGFDLGRSDDFASWAIAWMDDEILRLVSRSYTCSERRQELKTLDFSRWIASGQLVEHPGSQVDFREILSDIIEAHAKYRVKAWSFDPNFALVFAQ